MKGDVAILETNRLVLRAIRSTDIHDLFRMNSDPIVMRYVGDGSTRTREQMLIEIETLISYYAKRPGLGVWAIELKGSLEFIGAGEMEAVGAPPAKFFAYNFYKFVRYRTHLSIIGRRIR